jgi:hypothetical protein
VRRSRLALLGAAALVGGSTLSCLHQMTSMPGTSFSGAAPALTTDEAALSAGLRADVTTLATDIGERNLGRRPQQLEAAATWVEGALRDAGYVVVPEPYEVKGQPTRNLIAELPGTAAPKELIVVGAHYDSAEGTPGADDNASGVATALALARRLHATPLDRTVRFVFFTNEEPPYFATPDMGSEVSAKASKARGDDVKAMLSLETMGFFTEAKNSQHYPWPFSGFYPSTGHFIAFVADTDSRALAHEAVSTFREHATVASEGSSVPAFIEGVDWSDHGPYWRQGYRALMVTDTAPFRNPNYHEATDLPATLDFDRLARVTVGLERVVRRLATR